jgi:ATP-dependent protease ClpP protease subunit
MAAGPESQDRADPGFRVSGPVFNAATEGSGNTSATKAAKTRIDLYNEIGGWMGVWPDEFKASLDSVKGDVDLHIHSPGGDAGDGVAIYNMLRQHDGTVDVTVDGLAASAASVIAMAGNTVTMSRGSQMMIHNAWGLTVGDENDMESMRVRLGKANESMASIYAAKAGGTSADWRAAMRAESWYTDTEAVDAGLADQIETDTAAIKSRWDLKVFAHAGRENAPDPVFPAGHRSTRQPLLTNTTTATTGTFTVNPNSAFSYAFDGPAMSSDAAKVMASIKAAAERAAQKSPDTETSVDGSTGTTTEKEASDMPTAAKIQAALGLSEEATAKLLALLADDDGTEPTPEPDPKPDDEPKAKSKGYLPKASKDAESVVLDPETLAKLQAQARLGMEAHNEMKKQKRDAILDKAMDLGKFPPSRREHYATMYDADPDGAVELFDRMAENAVPVDVLGYSGVSEQVKSEADRAYANMGWGDQ